MATYKDKKTGTIISSDSEMSGDWELVKVDKSKTKRTTKASETETNTEVE